MNSTTVDSMYFYKSIKLSCLYWGTQLTNMGEGLFPLVDILLALALKTIKVMVIKVMGFSEGDCDKCFRREGHKWSTFD